MKRYVFYHAQCPDGFATAWAFYKKFGTDNVVYQACNYGEPIPQFEAGAEVYIGDYSFPRDVLLDMEKKSSKIVLLDHHRSAEKDLSGLSFATFDMNKSGAMLTWEYCHPGTKIPKMIDYVMDRDLWLFKQPHSKEAHAYLSTFAYDFKAWDELAATFENDFQRIIDMGAILLRSDELEVQSICAQSREILFEGHRIPCVNTVVLNSEVGNALLQLYPQAPFSLSWFVTKDGKIKGSLRSRGEFDVSELAKKLGGGGHKAAAGCSLERIPDYLS